MWNDRKPSGPIDIADFLTPTHPLGPTNHETINLRLGARDSNALIYRTEVFDEVTASKRPIIAGRKGSGKTAVVNALVANAHGQPYSWAERKVEDGQDIVVMIDSFEKLDVLLERVGQEIAHANGPQVDWTGIIPETSARYWANNLWRIIINSIYEREIAGQPWNRVDKCLLTINKYVTGKDIIDLGTPLTQRSFDQAFENAKEEVLAFLDRKLANCIVVIDSFEKYPLESPKFEKVISGLLRCVNNFNDTYRRCRVYLCLPEELEPKFRSFYPNLLKDGTEDISLSRLKWRPVDLLRIVAKRYREFLALRGVARVGSGDEARPVSSFKLDDRDELNEFFSLVFPSSIRNRYDCPESPLAYLIRHTHLLPREFLIITAAAIVGAHKRHGKWTDVSELDIVQAVREKEQYILALSLDQFTPHYPVLCNDMGAVMRETRIKPVFTHEEFISLSAKLQDIASHEATHLWDTLFQMGVIGYVDSQDNTVMGDNERYIYARFHFNSAIRYESHSGATYCFHPVCSGAWNLREGIACSDKFVYPADVPFDLMDVEI